MFANRVSRKTTPGVCVLRPGSSVNMDLLKHVPHLMDTDVELARQILFLTFTFIQAKCLFHICEMEQQQKEQPKNPKRRRHWIRPYLRRRREYGHYDNLMRELSLELPEKYRNFTRIDTDIFHEIVARLQPILQKKTTNFREPLSVGLRVAITLRYLATGETYTSLGYAFRVAHNTISKLIPETCSAIISQFGKEVVKLPKSPQEWKAIAKEYEEKWNLPHCVGAIDGKHIRITSPKKSGSLYYNYKKYFSVLLLGVVDADYKFIYADVGAVGSQSDAGVFAQTHLYNLIDHMEINLPEAECLPNDPDGMPVDYFIAGDEAFALKTWMQKPYPDRGLTVEERIFNYRLSRGRRVVENAFGILAARY